MARSRDPVEEHIIEVCGKVYLPFMEEVYFEARSLADNDIDIVLLMLTPEQVHKHHDELIMPAINMVTDELEDLA